MHRISQKFPHSQQEGKSPLSHSIHRAGGSAGTQKGPGCYKNRKNTCQSLLKNLNFLLQLHQLLGL